MSGGNWLWFCGCFRRNKGPNQIVYCFRLLGVQPMRRICNDLYLRLREQLLNNWPMFLLYIG